MKRSSRFLATAAGLAALFIPNTIKSHEMDDSPPAAQWISAPERLAPEPAPLQTGSCAPGEDDDRRVGPAQVAPVIIGELLVAEGDRVDAGQVVAYLAGREASAVSLERVRSLERHARARHADALKLFEADVLSRSRLEERAAYLELATLGRRAAEEELERFDVRAPVSGWIVDIHTGPGEPVGERGILQLRPLPQEGPELENIA